MTALFKVFAFGSLVSAAAGKFVDQCPLLPMRPAEECTGEVSECWSPGEADTDCPDNGFCCFNGCVNICGVPYEDVPEVPHTCTTDYVTQTEDVPEEVCVEIPGMETCVTTNTTECEQDCDFVDHPETVTEVTTCCRTTKQLVCNEAPCDPDGGSSEEVPFEETVCKKREKVCYNVPEQVCSDEEVQECRDVEKEVCKTVKKPTERPTTRQECVTRYAEKCEVVYRKVCSDGVGHKNSKLHHLFKKKRFPWQRTRFDARECFPSPTKVCRQEPYTECKDVTAVTIEHEDAEECDQVTENVCTNKIVPTCVYVDKDRCNEAEDICETNKGSRTVFVKNNCLFVGKECHFEDVEECEDHSEEVEKFLSKKVCKNVCKPVAKSECKRDDPTGDCRTVFKTMTYKVPVQKC